MNEDKPKSKLDIEIVLKTSLNTKQIQTIIEEYMKTEGYKVKYFRYQIENMYPSQMLLTGIELTLEEINKNFLK